MGVRGNSSPASLAESWVHLGEGSCSFSRRLDFLRFLVCIGWGSGELEVIVYEFGLSVEHSKSFTQFLRM